MEKRSKVNIKTSEQELSFKDFKKTTSERKKGLGPVQMEDGSIVLMPDLSDLIRR